ncbi:MAG: RsmE family RNA methyltransferase [Rhodothermales bacterium]
MNLILLDSEDLDVVLPLTDPRAVHIMKVLRRSTGDSFDVGLIDGRTGKGRIDRVDGQSLRIFVRWTGEGADLYPITMILGMPRPQTARRLLREMTAMGVSRLLFCETDRSDPGYASSSLWTSGEFERHLKTGAEQAFNPRLPDLHRFNSLAEALDSINSDGDRLALDNYEAPLRLSSWKPSMDSAVLSLGAERGWSAAERTLLLDAGFSFYHLGARVLRIETAATAAVAIALSRMGFV